MLKNKFIIVVLFMLSLLVFLINSQQADAASASVSVTTEKSTFKKGDKVYITIRVSSNEEIGGFEGYFSYDNSILRYVTGGSVIHGNDDEFLISDLGRAAGSNQIKYVVKFVARAAGSTTITLKQPYSVCSYGDDESLMSVSYSPLIVVVEKNKKAVQQQETVEPSGSVEPGQEEPQGTTGPDNNTATETPYIANNSSSRLKSLKVKGVTLSPAFSPGCFKYTATAYTDLKSLDIAYDTEDQDAAVTIKGNKNISEGNNNIKIKVTSAAGTKSVYKLSINVVNNSSYKNNRDLQTYLRNGEVVLSTRGEYTVTKLEDEGLVPEGFGETDIKLGDQLVTAYASESETEHRFFLIYCKKDGTSPEFYLYDKEELTIMPYAKVQAWYRGSNGGVKVTGDEDNDTEVQKFKYILAIVIIICLLLVIIIISVYMHFKGMDKDDLTEVLIDNNDRMEDM